MCSSISVQCFMYCYYFVIKYLYIIMLTCCKFLLLSSFPIRCRYSAFSIHFGRTLHLLSLLPPTCPPSPHPISPLPHLLFPGNCISSTLLPIQSCPFERPSDVLIPNLVLPCHSQGKPYAFSFLAVSLLQYYIITVTTLLEILNSQNYAYM